MLDPHRARAGRGDEHPWRFYVPGDPNVSRGAVAESIRPGRFERVAVDEQLRDRCTADAVDAHHARPSCARSSSSGRPLRVKLGIDPTASDIHLGFAVVLRKLRQFQELGHTAVLILGDFTAQVGDPSGARPPARASRRRRSTRTPRPTSSRSRRILCDEPLEIRRNSEWLATMDIEDVLRLAVAHHRRPHARARRLRQPRYSDGVAISVMEFLYPLLQGWDSVMVEADVELGGTDQLFNLLMGRTLQEQEGQEAQVVLTTPLLVGLDGVQKMSKSLGNYVGIAEPPAEQFGKLMSIPDELMPPLLRAHHRLAPRRGSTRSRGSSPPARSSRSTRSACSPARSSTCTTATARVRRPRPSSTGSSAPRGTRRDPGDVHRPRPSVRDGRIRLANRSSAQSRRRCSPTRKGAARSCRAGCGSTARWSRTPIRRHAGRARRQLLQLGSATGPAAADGAEVRRADAVEQGEADDRRDPIARSPRRRSRRARPCPARRSWRRRRARPSASCRSRRRADLGRCWRGCPSGLLGPLDPWAAMIAGVRETARPACRWHAARSIPVRPENLRWIDTDALLTPPTAESRGGRGECRLGARGITTRPHGVGGLRVE